LKSENCVVQEPRLAIPPSPPEMKTVLHVSHVTLVDDAKIGESVRGRTRFRCILKTQKQINR
jgi:hypothetical protein